MPTGERVKLLDFGIAKLGGDETKAGLTKSGAVMGTPKYMAPEQCRGAGSVDRRADLYALGCILYEMLCGRPPFVAEGVGDIIAHHMYFQPQPPRALDPSIAPPLEALVLALLQKDPAHRPPTALAVVEAIDRLDPAAGSARMQLEAPTPAPTGSPVTTLSSATTSIGTGARPPSRRPIMLVAVGGIAAAAVIAVAVVTAGGDRGTGDGLAAATQIDAAPELPVPVVDAAPAPPPPPLADAAIAEVSADAAVAPAPEPPKSVAVKPEKRPPPAPRNIPPAKLEANRIGGNKHIVPDAETKTAIAKSGKAKIVGSYRLCLDAQGAISSVSQRKSSGFTDYDAKILDEMKQWTYKPYVLDEEAVPVCTTVTVIYSQPSSPNTTPPPSEVKPTCTRSAFASVLQAKQPDEATVQAALARLKKCQKDLSADVYAELQQQLISKL